MTSIPRRRLRHTGWVRVARDQVAVLAAALVWLAMLGFPVAYALSGAASGVALGVPLAALALLVAVYLRAVIRSARDGAPQPAPLSLAVVAAVAVALPLAVGAGWFGGTVFLAALLGLTLPVRQALVALAAVTGLAVAQAALIDVASPQAISVPLVTAVSGLVVVVVVRQSVLTRELAASRWTAERLAVEAERLRLARELHDSVKQQAFVAALELASARSRLGPDEHLDAAAHAVATVQRQLGEVIEHVRVPERQLLAALREHLAEWSRRTGVTANLTVGSPPAEYIAAEPLLTVAVEALTNVARHARAGQVAVTLNRQDDQAVLEIVDDGRGFDVQRTPFGQGLRGMRERLAEHGGALDLRSDPGGTTVVARYPATLL
ncbi:MAG: sensor histidine kinase [Pseudonocardiaceae bacterium]